MESKYRGYRAGERRYRTLSSREIHAADLFYADLVGRRVRRRRAAAPAAEPAPAAGWAPPEPVAPAVASWERPDLIFDNNYRLSPQEAELGELMSEGWQVVAMPNSRTPLSDLKRSDIVLSRALGEGRLAVVRVLGEDVEAESLYSAYGRISPETMVLRRIGYGEAEDTPPAVTADSGEDLIHLPMLRAHGAAGFIYNLNGPNCVMRWARVPRNYSGPLDVIVHFHGYKKHNAMRLRDKANASGLDLGSPGVTAPTLGLVPQGRAFLSSTQKDMDGFDFPAISSARQLQGFVDAGVAALKAAIGSNDRTITTNRVVLTGHSGGGAALNLLMRSIGSAAPVRAFHYFDATYGGAAVMTQPDGWLVNALRRDVRLIKAASSDEARARAMADSGGGLRILFIDGSPTAPVAKQVDRFIDQTLRDLLSDAGQRALLRRYYRAQAVSDPKAVDHGRVPRVFGGRLLADGGHNLEPEARSLPAPMPAPPRPTPRPSEDAPTATPAATPDPAQFARVSASVNTTLSSFRNILVKVPGPTAQAIAVPTPYFINKPTSPSRLRAEQKRPALMRNQAIAAAYGNLPSRAKVGKSYPADVRTFLQSALDANAVPNQAAGVTPASLNAFLSDAGVGVDCSGFVSQALIACMAEFGRTDTLNAHSSQLRGGPGHNAQFEVISRPADLKPGDTMWKEGHIRIVQSVEPQGDGSVQFATAESSSVGLIGGVAKRWKAPKADRFTGVQVERGGVFRANNETNVYSRYRPLAEAMRSPAAARPTEDTPPPMPSSSRSAPPPPPPAAPAPAPVAPAAPAPAAGVAGGTAAVVPKTLTQPEVDRLAAITFGNGADIDAFFARKGATGFIDWFNRTWAGKAPFKRSNGGAIQIAATPVVQQRFTAFWNSLPQAYDRPRINALEFVTLMSIVLNETGGNFAAFPEQCGRGRSDARGDHPGLAYAFDKIVNVKASYNTLSGNRRAGALFNDADYIRAHGTLGGAQRLTNKGNEFGGAWNSEFYPQAEFSTAEDLAQNGFIMQADFYKFRGRGVIQTTSREAYLAVVKFIQAYAGTNTVLTDFKQRWSSGTADVAATVSTNAEWDSIFSQGEILARAVRLHSGSGKSDYLTMSPQAGTLLHVPAPLPKGVPRGMQGSIFFMGRRISGRYSYGAGAYRDRVMGILNSMLRM